MDSILEHVSDKNKEWVSKLSMKDIALLIESLSVIPAIKNTIINNPKLFDIHNTNSEKPAIKGMFGELEFEEICKNNLSDDYKLINTAKRGKMADFLISWTSLKTNKLYNILIDVKNYKPPVPTKEITKFYNDINLNANIDGGILISLYSKITGSNCMVDFTYHLSNNGKLPVIFLNNRQPDIMIEVIKMIFHTIEINDIGNNMITNDEEIMMHLNDLNVSAVSTSICRNSLIDAKHSMEKSFNNISLELMVLENTIISKISKINSLIISKGKITRSITDSEKKIDNPGKSNTLTIIDNNQNSNLSETIIFVNNIISQLSKPIVIKYEHLLYEICGQVKWKTSIFNNLNQEWHLVSENDNSMIIKFMKSKIVVTTCLDKSAIEKYLNEYIIALSDITFKKNKACVELAPHTLDFINKIYK
jgi:hypothetical protein